MILTLHLSPGLKMLYPSLPEVLEHRPESPSTTLAEALAAEGMNPLLIVAAESSGKVIGLHEPITGSRDIKLITHMGGG